MSIATMRGDGGQTSLIGGRRVSKGSGRIEAIGTIDELGAQLAFARAICPHPETGAFMRDVQRQLFAIAETLATEPASTDAPPSLDRTLVDALTARGHRLRVLGPYGMSTGVVAVGVDPRNGTLRGGADLRRERYIFGW